MLHHLDPNSICDSIFNAHRVDNVWRINIGWEEYINLSNIIIELFSVKITFPPFSSLRIHMRNHLNARREKKKKLTLHKIFFSSYSHDEDWKKDRRRKKIEETLFFLFSSHDNFMCFHNWKGDKGRQMWVVKAFFGKFNKSIFIPSIGHHLRKQNDFSNYFRHVIEISYFARLSISFTYGAKREGEKKRKKKVLIINNNVSHKLMSIASIVKN